MRNITHPGSTLSIQTDQSYNTNQNTFNQSMYNYYEESVTESSQIPMELTSPNSNVLPHTNPPLPNNNFNNNSSNKNDKNNLKNNKNIKYRNKNQKYDDNDNDNDDYDYDNGNNVYEKEVDNKLLSVPSNNSGGGVVSNVIWGAATLFDATLKIFSFSSTSALTTNIVSNDTPSSDPVWKSDVSI